MLFTKKIFFSLIFLFLFMPSSYAEEAYFSINYGITSQNDNSFSAVSGSPSVDNDDQGFMISAGTLVWENLGIDLMYYDLGSTSITVSSGDRFSVDGQTMEVDKGSSGTISSDTTGYGIGVIGTTGNSGYTFGFNAYGKFGVHQWDKSGSTTLLLCDACINPFFYNDGTDLYAGFGIGINVTPKIAINIAYDTLSFADQGFSTSEMSSLASIGVKTSF